MSSFNHMNEMAIWKTSSQWWCFCNSEVLSCQTERGCVPSATNYVYL